MRTIAISNHKGGTAKTEVSRNIAAVLASRGFKVLIIDLDDQGNMSEDFGIDIENLDTPCITHVLLNKYDNQFSLDDVMLNALDLPVIANNEYLSEKVKQAYANINIVPCNITFDDADYSTLRTRALYFALKNMKTEIDYVILDCPPNLKIVTKNAFLAADFVVIPANAELPYVTSLVRTKDAIQTNAVGEGMTPAIWKILVNRLRTNTISGQMGVEEIVDTFGKEMVFDIMIPDSVKASEARQVKQIVTFYRPNSVVSKAFNALVDEILITFDNKMGVIEHG